MAVLKCKMCGGDLNPHAGETVCECEFCGTKQTVSISNDERLLSTIARGNLLRNKCEFDKAYNLFSQCVVDGTIDAEVYWNLVLCKYGITYVDDYDGSKKPTINRMSNISILDDDDYLKCLELADVIAREQYKEEANKINQIQNEVLEIVKKEKPYDIFISYKETDEFGERTKDSLLAYEIYDSLVKEGYKVFLSRVTLSKVIGKSYEPYIYSALYTSKVMLLVSTTEDYVNAVWVKNEWSRFLALKKKDDSRVIIPCYKDMDPYDFPKELRNIQSVDLSKIGAIQDIKIGLKKIITIEEKDEQSESNDFITKRIAYISNLIKDRSNTQDIEKARLMLENFLIDYPDSYDFNKLYFYIDYDIENFKEFFIKALDFRNDISEEELLAYIDVFDDEHLTKMIQVAKNMTAKNGFTAIKYCLLLRTVSPEFIENLDDYNLKKDKLTAKIDDSFKDFNYEDDEVKRIVKAYYVSLFNGEGIGLISKYIEKGNKKISYISPLIHVGKCITMDEEELKTLLTETLSNYKKINNSYFLLNPNFKEDIDYVCFVCEIFTPILNNDWCKEMVLDYMTSVFDTKITNYDDGVEITNTNKDVVRTILIANDMKYNIITKLSKNVRLIKDNLAKISPDLQIKFSQMISNCFDVFNKNFSIIDENFYKKHYDEIRKLLRSLKYNSLTLSEDLDFPFNNEKAIIDEINKITEASKAEELNNKNAHKQYLNKQAAYKKESKKKKIIFTFIGAGIIDFIILVAIIVLGAHDMISKLMILIPALIGAGLIGGYFLVDALINK